MPKGANIDLGLTGYDELFMDDASRAEAKLPRIYILPQCSTTAARLLNPAGMDAQFERSRCASWGGILSLKPTIPER